MSTSRENQTFVYQESRIPPTSQVKTRVCRECEETDSKAIHETREPREPLVHLLPVAGAHDSRFTTE